LSAGVRELKLEQSLVLFKQGHLSLWKAARLANVSLREMIHSLYLHNIRPEIDEQLIQEELA
jgi:predicted HTH domain antitoxin